jgi:hypothetical protein
MTLNMMSLSIIAFRVMKLIKTTLCKMAFTLMTLSITAFSIMTLSIMAFSKTGISVITLSIMTLSKRTLSVIIKMGHSAYHLILSGVILSVFMLCVGKNYVVLRFVTQYLLQALS